MTSSSRGVLADLRAYYGLRVDQALLGPKIISRKRVYGRDPTCFNI
jgi:hypothetical protein